MRLLMIVLTSIELMLAASLVLYRRTRRVYPGFDGWTLAEALQAGGYLALSLRGLLPDALSIFGANVVFPLAAVVRLAAVRRFFDLPPMSRLWYGVPALQLALLLVASLAPNAAAGRGAVTSAAVAVPVLSIAAVVWRRSPMQHRFFQGTIAAAMAFLGVLLAARAVALLFAVTSTTYAWATGSVPEEAVFVAIIVGHVAVTVGFLMLNGERLESDLLRTEASLRHSVSELQQALADNKVLSGLLPICAACKKIRNDDGYWTRIETYISRHSAAQFTHGICPDCARALYPDEA